MAGAGGAGCVGGAGFGEAPRAGRLVRMHLTMAETEVSRLAAQRRARRQVSSSMETVMFFMGEALWQNQEFTWGVLGACGAPLF
jgi:hypothetical protein